jgi:predicted peroxiredoxin
MVNGKDMVVVLRSGKHDRGMSATLAFSWACTSLAMNKKVTLFLTMDGTVWALRDAARKVEVGGFEPLDEYIQQFFSLGGNMFVCAPCTEYYCTTLKDDVSHKLLPEAKLAGLSTIVGMISPETTVVTF